MLILISGCTNSLQTCVDYCMDINSDYGETTASGFGQAWNLYQEAKLDCKKECLNKGS